MSVIRSHHSAVQMRNFSPKNINQIYTLLQPKSIKKERKSITEK